MTISEKPEETLVPQCRPVRCRMQCPNGWDTDPQTGCDICQCSKYLHLSMVCLHCLHSWYFCFHDFTVDKYLYYNKCSTILLCIVKLINICAYYCRTTRKSPMRCT